MKKIGKERTAGFSLLEVVVAIAIIGLIFAIALLALMIYQLVKPYKESNKLTETVRI